MIGGFKHRGLKRFYERGDASRIGASYRQKVADILSVLDVAQDIEDMNLATLRLHPLTGHRQGTWSVTVRANWRITFRFEDGCAYDVNLEDYH